MIQKIQGRASFLDLCSRLRHFVVPSLAFAGLALLSSPSFGAITITSLPSHLNPTTDNKTQATIYAGKSHDTSSCPGVLSADPCDTCAAITTISGPTTCNRTSIYPTHVFSVTFSSDNAAAFTTASKVMMLSGSDVVNLANATSITLAANTAITAQFKWSEICSTFGTSGDSVCDKSFTKSVTVGVSKDGTTGGMTDSFTLQINFRSLAPGGNYTPIYHTNCSSTTGAAQYEGVCGFTVAPGDGKVYFGNILIPLASAGSSVNSWPATEATGVNWAGMMIYYRLASDQGAGTTNFGSTEWTPLSPHASDTYVASLAIGADGSMPKTRVTGLANDMNYVFMIASYDQAGNIANFSDITGTNNTDFFDVTKTGAHYGRPGEVVGLLSNKKCFIATAAFGSEMEPRVELLRKFRNEYLLTSTWGREFVKTYYQLSPPLADFIRDHESLRAVVRAVLAPVIAWAQFCLDFGFVSGILLVIVLGFVAQRILRQVKLIHALRPKRSR